MRSSSFIFGVDGEEEERKGFTFTGEVSVCCLGVYRKFGGIIGV
jgi:hypothetical protein